MQLEQRNFRADPLKLKRLRITANMSAQDFQVKTGLHKDTVRKILRGDPVFLSTLSLAVLDAFGISDPIEILHPQELAELGLKTEFPAPGHILEWEIDAYLSGWQQTSNGLQYQLLRLHHRYLENRIARGKCYELRHLSTQQRKQMEQYLVRHAEVCEKTGGHPNVAINLTSAPVDGLWWVLDRWEDGETLETRLGRGALSDYELNFIMRGIAMGLAELHRCEVIRRELSPKSILLRERDDRPILTDMELAKLTSGKPTVSPERWPDDPYRALEVCGGSACDPRADVYSWARVFVHAANGSLPPRGEEQLHPSGAIPNKVRELVLKAASITPSARPTNMTEVLEVLRVWS